MGSYGPCGSTSYPGIRNLCYDNTGAGYLHVHLHQNTRYQKGLFTKLGSKEDQELEKLINQPEPWSTNQVRRAITHTHTHTHTHTNKQADKPRNKHARARTHTEYSILKRLTSTPIKAYIPPSCNQYRTVTNSNFKILIA